MLQMPSPLLRCLPEIIGIEKFREFRVDVDHMDIAFVVISDHSFVVVAPTIRFNIDTERSVNLELKSGSSSYQQHTSAFKPCVLYLLTSLDRLPPSSSLRLRLLLPLGRPIRVIDP